MYRLSVQAIQEFRKLHKLKFGIRPSPEQAEHDLLLLMQLVQEIQNRDTRKQR